MHQASITATPLQWLPFVRPHFIDYYHKQADRKYEVPLYREDMSENNIEINEQDGRDRGAQPRMHIAPGTYLVPIEPGWLEPSAFTPCVIETKANFSENEIESDEITTI